jgi:type I restriction enzyme S subunit
MTAIMGDPNVRLGDCLTVLTDYHANGSYEMLRENVTLLDEPDYAVMIRTTNFEKEDFVEGLKYIHEHAYHFLAKSKVYPGDIVMNKIASPGSVFRMPNLGRPVSLAMNLFLLRTDETRLDQTYAYYWLKANETYVKSFACGAATATITKKAVRELELPLPSLSAQRRIVGILVAYEELIENNQRRIRILEKMARALYREWFVHFRFPGHETVSRVPSPLGPIPQGWEVRNVKDVATVTYGLPFQSKRFNSDRNGTPVIRIRDIPEGFSATFTDEDAEPKYYVKNGHILIGMDGDFHMCIWSSGHAFQNQRVARFESNGEIGNLHLFLVLEKPIQELNSAIVGTTVAHLGDMHIKRIQIIWPPADLRAKGREVLEPMSEQVIALKRQIQNLRQTRDLLLPRLLSGQLSATMSLREN